jgi:APA family basic amino acid/polyamine antiporter
VSAELPRRLGLLDSVAIVVGIVIGGGIFVVPNLVAQNLPSAGMILAVWTLAGVVSFFGALACAELGSAFPTTGGQYIYVREAYGPLAGFLCGWSMFTISRSAQVAWLAVTFALYLSYFVPLGPVVSKVLALVVLALFTGLNYRGVRVSAALQKTFTAAKLAGALLIVGSAFLAHTPAPVPAAAASFSFRNFGVALIACLLAYDGWAQVTYVAGEIRNPKRNVVLALAVGTSVVMAIYLLANLAYLRVLTIPEIAASPHVAASAAERTLGTSGGSLVSLIILTSILGTLNGCFLTTPRLYFAQASDGLFFRQFGRVSPRFETPGFAILAQAAWSAFLIVTGSYETLIDYALFAIWLFYGVMVAAVLILRRTRPGIPRPYRMWGYPVTPLLFLDITAWFLGNMLVTRPGPSLSSLALIVAGVPAYWYFTRVARPAN